MPRKKTGTAEKRTLKEHAKPVVVEVPEPTEVEVSLDQQRVSRVVIVPTTEGACLATVDVENGYLDTDGDFRRVGRDRFVYKEDAGLGAPWAAVEAAIWALIDAGSE
jgi:hypothetical protein